MKTFKYLFSALVGVAALTLTSCLSDYQELNTDPELLGVASPQNAFTSATENFNNNSRSHLTGKYSGVMVYMQYLVPKNGGSEGSYFDPAKTNSHPAPYAPAYNDYFNTHGLRLSFLLSDVIPTQGTEAEKYNDVGAITVLLLSYKQWQILDTYGAAPITEGLSLQTAGIKTPRYDLYQQGIDGVPMYQTIDEQVADAVTLLQMSDKQQYSLGKNDFFYKGDIKKWIKFGNTLRVKMAQRLEKADPAFYQAVIGEVLTSADNIIASNDESCIYYHANDYNNNTDDIQDITDEYMASAAFVNYLEAYNDPRLPLLVRQNGVGPGNTSADNETWFETFKKEYPDYTTTYADYTDRYSGASANPKNRDDKKRAQAWYDVTYHKEDGSEATMTIRLQSQMESRYFVKNGGRNGNNNITARDMEGPEYEINQDRIGCFTPILTYPETCQMLAEIALKKGTAVAGKDATAWFKAGIRASMEQYRDWANAMYVVSQTASQSATYNPLTDAKIDAYMAQPEFQTATLEKIISQQWINLYTQPEEMWATWKRTGLPAFKLDPIPADGVAFLETIEGGDTPQLTIPRRNILPTPNTMNLDNFNAAVDALKSDTKYGKDVQATEGRIWWDK